MADTEKINLQGLAEVISRRRGDDVWVMTDLDTQFIYVLYEKEPRQVFYFGGSATKEQIIDLLKAEQIGFQEAVNND